jgi:hypothetical protein
LSLKELIGEEEVVMIEIEIEKRLNKGNIFKIVL